MAIELQDKLYTSAQVADVLGVSLRTLYRYMEDGRIESMKTASGRHRFTKEQILAFLDGGGLDLEPEMEDRDYRAQPSRDSRERDVRDIREQRDLREPRENRFAREDRESFAPAAPRTQPQPSNDFSFYPNNKTESRNELNDPYNVRGKKSALDDFEDFDVEEDEDDDDDFNFSFDSRKPKAPEPVYNQRPVRETPVAPVSRPNPFVRDDRDLGQSANRGYTPSRPFERTERPTPQPVRPVPSNPYGGTQPSRPTPISRERPASAAMSADNMNVRYYKSDYNDLIDLAKRIKETALSKDLEYAFTLNAGLSLHYLIDPFTILHFYVNPEDLQVWKSSLGLVPVSSKSEANIGILVNTDVVFIPTKEIGGFKVVEDKLLMKDLARASEEDLVREFRQRILSA